MPYDKKKITRYEVQVTNYKKKPEKEKSRIELVMTVKLKLLGILLERWRTNKCRRKIAIIRQALYDGVPGKGQDLNKKVMPANISVVQRK